jgi:hypothetical protein
MVMTAATLSTELQAIAPGTDEVAVRDGWAAAYTNYMRQSAVQGVSPMSASVLAGAKAAMAAALVGIATPQASGLPAATLIVNGLVAFWTAALTAGATVWVTVPFPLVAAPFTLPVALLAPATVGQALAAVFAANTTARLSKAAAYDAIVAVLHPAGAGATVTQAATPSPTPGIPVL